MQEFWDMLAKLSKNVWDICDDAWKALRWNVSAATALAIYSTSQDERALWMTIGLSVFAVTAMVGYIFKWLIGGLTGKGREDMGIITIVIAFLFFVTSIFIAVAVWAILVSMNLVMFQLAN